MVKPLVSVVMLCWNRVEDVSESLTRLNEQTYAPLEIIVVDNASTDGTAERVAAEFPSVVLVRMESNIGIAAYNVGFRMAKGKYIVTLDDDSFPARLAFSRMVEKFEQNDRLGIVAFDVRNYSAYDHVAQESNDTASAQSARYLMSFNGAGAGIRSDLFEQVGYYPEEHFLYQNELDVALKVLDAGFEIQFFPDVVAYHKYSLTNRSSERAPYFYTRNAFWIIWKYYPPYSAFLNTVRLGYKCCYYSLEQHTTVYLRAMLAAFVNARKLRGRRRPIRKEIARNIRVPLDLNFTFYR